jgi:peptidyl-prolyl cis-trans isomerase SurA
MNKQTHIYCCAILAAISLTSGQLLAQTLELSDTGVKLDGIAALVNDGVVLQSELEAQTATIVQRLRNEGTALPPADSLQKQVLDNLVLGQIQLQRAERDGITIPDEMLNRALSDIAQRNNTTLSGMPALLAADGIDYAAFRNDLREQLIMERLRMRDVTSRIAVSEREIDDYLEREATSSYRNNRYKLSHILISLPANTSPQDLEAAQKKADEIYQKLQNGRDFAELAVTYSNAESALDGGSMGWRNGDSLPTLFAGIVPNLQKGQVSEPIRTASGLHIVKLDDVEGNKPVMEKQVRARHILIETDEIVDDEVAKQKLSEIRMGILGGDDFAAVAKAVSDDAGSAVEGGDLGWAGPNTYVGIFEETLTNLKIGEISMPFRSEFGWHIVEVLERRTHDTTDDVRRTQAITAIRDSKLAEETELWLRQIRDESFVEYRL